MVSCGEGLCDAILCSSILLMEGMCAAMEDGGMTGGSGLGISASAVVGDIGVADVSEGC